MVSFCKLNELFKYVDKKDASLNISSPLIARTSRLEAIFNLPDIKPFRFFNCPNESGSSKPSLNGDMVSCISSACCAGLVS